MDRVIIDDSLSKNAHHMEALKPMLPILNRVAWLWEKTIVIRELRSNLTENITDQSVMYVNLFFGHSVSGAASESANSIFGYSPKENESNGIILKYYPVSGGQYSFGPSAQRSMFDNGFRTFFSPEGNCIARVKDRSVNILVNFSKINPEGAKDILEIILMFSVPVVFSQSKSAKKSIARKMIFGSRQFRSLEKDREKLAESVCKYVKNNLKNSLIGLESKLAAASEKISDTEKKRIENWTKVSELESAFKSLSEKVKAGGDYAGQFEQLLRIEGVRDVLVEGESLVIYTDLIHMIRGDKSYNLGAYRIILDPKPNQGHQGIKFQRYVCGDYIHHHINDDAVVCFGGGDFGLNSALDKLMQDFDVIPVAHLVMSFLRFEESEPRESRNKFLTNKFPEVISGKSSDSKKSEFCNFMCNAILKLLQAPMLASLIAYRKAESELQNSYLTARSELQSLIGQVGYMRSKMDSDFLSEIKSGLLELENNQKSKGVSFRRGLRIVVDDDSLEWPILVWIEADRLPWIIALGNQIPVLDGSRHVFFSPDSSDLFSKLLSTRNLPAVGLQVISEIFNEKKSWFRRLLS